MIMELCRLVRDVELKKMNFNGEERSVLNNAIAIAINKEQSAFIDMTAWGKTAETMAAYLKKGDEVVIKGELRNKKYKADNKEITMPYVLVSSFEFTYGNKRGQNNEKGNEGRHEQDTEQKWDLPFDSE